MFLPTSFILEVSLDVRHTGSTGHPSNVDVAFRVPVSVASLGGLFVNITVQFIIFDRCYT